jgi:DNA-binding NtrC family response regulator
MTKAHDAETILVVDDSPAAIELITRNLGERGYRMLAAASVDEAVRLLDKGSVDLVITDLKMPGPSGMDLVRHVRQSCHDTEVMMVTGFATVEGAVEAIKGGAEEYLQKPFTSEELLAAVARVLERLHVRRTARSRSLATPRSPHGIIGESEAMQRVYRTVAKAARSRATALITGESGTGKELVARAIHYSGPRAAAPFVAVNCGGIPEGLLESELFGHVKGSFTGATETRAGFFRTADGGTIFLDEVGETSLAMQVKLLRVLQDGEVVMVGSSRPLTVDVRVIAATNQDLAGLVGRGAFREDLYYRLNVIAIDIPPLRDRGDDILLLIDHFARKHSRDTGRNPPRFTDAALDVLRRHHWPGNVRALENVIHRMIVMAESDAIDVADLPPLLRSAILKGRHDASRSLFEVESEHIRAVLAAAGGNKTRAAEILGIDRKTLRDKLRRMEAEPG